MSRTTLIIILGVAASLMVIILMGTAVFFGRSYFMIADSSGQVVTPVVLLETAVPITSLTPTATSEATVTLATTTTQTDVPTSSPTPTAVTQSNQTAACTDAATYVADVTIPDGTQLPPSTSFTKTWRLKNSGTCTWNSQYKLFHQAGNVLGAAQTNMPLPAVVAPGQTIDLSVNMVSPALPGNYQSDWLLQNAQGRPFGVGRSSSPFWVKIGVAVPNEQPTGSISGYLWNDYCLTNENGDALDGSCVADGNGGYRADGMIQSTETYISGVIMRMQLGSCTNNNNVVLTAVTDNTGRYTFGSLQPATYCISMNAAEGGNGAKLLPGDWTFPQPHIWYQEITLLGGDQAFPVNFGWDYQLN